MTFEEFNNTNWGAGMFALYQGTKYPIVSCDFEEKLVALEGIVQGSDEPSWVRCENIELLEE